MLTLTVASHRSCAVFGAAVTISCGDVPYRGLSQPTEGVRTRRAELHPLPAPAHCRYWHCLLLTEPTNVAGASRTAWEAAASVYQSITLTAMLIGTSEVLMLLGMYSA